MYLYLLECALECGLYMMPSDDCDECIMVSLEDVLLEIREFIESVTLTTELLLVLPQTSKIINRFFSIIALC